MGFRMTSPTFVGRRQDLDELRRGLDRARDGDPTVLLVGGDAGVGKSRLLASFLEDATEAGAHVLSGGCVDLGEGALPFTPLVEGLRTQVAVLGADEVRRRVGPATRELGRLVPGLDAATPATDPTRDPRVRVFESTLALLANIGDGAPVVLTVEDLHWADPSTLDLLAYLTRNLREDRLLVVATYRTDELHRRHPLHGWLAEMGRHGIVGRLLLRPFDHGELTELVAAILGHAPDPRLVDQILDRSEGNPFYAEELLAARSAGDPHGLPPTLREIVAARLLAVDEATREVLRLVAAAGREVDHRLLVAVDRLPAADLSSGLRDAMAHNLLVASSDGTAYRFRHALLQEAVHDELLPGERVELHRAFARALVAEPGLACCGTERAAAELAHHWYAAHELDEAFIASIAAADEAVAMFALAEARTHLDRALTLWDRVMPDTRAAAPPRHELEGRAAETTFFAGNHSRALAHARAAVDAAVAVDAPAPVLLHHRAELARMIWVSGDSRAAVAELEAALADHGDEPGPELAHALGGYGRLLMLRGRYVDAIAPSRRAVELARELGDRPAEGRALNSLGTSMVSALDVAGLAHLEEAIAIARAEEVVDDVMRGYVNLTSVLNSLGDHDRALAEAAACRAWSTERGIRVEGANNFIALNEVDAHVALGQWDRARAILDGLPPVDTGVSALNLAVNQAGLAVATGRFDDARRLLERAEHLGSRVVDLQFVAPTRRAQVELAIWEDRPLDALAAVTAVLDLRSDWDAWTMSPELVAWATRGCARVVHADVDAPSTEDARKALVVLAEIAAGVVELPVGDVLPRRRMQAILHEIEAEVRGVDAPDAEAWARADEAAWETSPPYERAWVRWRRADVLAGDDPEAAARLLADAHDIATGLGARPLRDAVETTAARHRIRLAAAPTDDDVPAGLTPREHEVLRLVALGRSNREIGEELFITAKTASVHVSNILAKFGVSSRGEAAAVAHRDGLV